MAVALLLTTGCLALGVAWRASDGFRVSPAATGRRSLGVGPGGRVGTGGWLALGAGGRPPSDGGDRLAPLDRLRAATTSFIADFRRELLTDPTWLEYGRCMDEYRGSAACERLRDAGLASVYWKLAGTLDADTYNVGEITEQIGSGVVGRELAEQYGEAADEIDRLAILALLGRTPGMGYVALPQVAYRHLAASGTLEKSLVLDRHREQLSLPDAETAALVQELAASRSTDPGLQLTAIRALGHPQTAQELADVARELSSGGSLDATTAPVLGAALGGCGPECLQVVEELLLSPHEASRRAAYGAINRTTGLGGGEHSRLRALAYRRVVGEQEDSDRSRELGSQ